MRRPLSLLFALAFAACGGGSSPTDPPDGGGNDLLSASIDGAAWSATPSLIYASGNTSSVPGGLIFSGSVLSPSQSLTLNLTRISGPGTYPLGVNIGTTAGGVLQMTQGSTSWWTPLNGDGGTVTITSMNNGRVAGTFSGNLTRLAGTAGNEAVVVTNGKFNVPINPGYTAPAADDKGSTVIMNIGNEEFYGATVVGLGGGTSLIGATASNLRYTVSITAGPVDGPGTMPMSNSVPLRWVRVIGVPGVGGAWGGVAGDVGTFTVTSVTGNRMAGTFSGTLAPVTGGGAGLVVSGEFDVRTAP